MPNTVDLEKVGQGHGIRHAQGHNSMANINVCTIYNRIFVLALTISEKLMFQMFDLENLGQDHGVQHSQ